MTVQYYQKCDKKPTHDELAKWCQKTFKLEAIPKRSTVTKWISPKVQTQLLTTLCAEASSHTQAKKAMYECKYPVLESQLIEWFIKVSRNQSAIITDSVLHEKALDIHSARTNVHIRSARDGYLTTKQD